MKAISSLPRIERPQLFLVVDDAFQNDFECYHPFIDKFDGIIHFSGYLHIPNDIINPPLIHCTSQNDLFEKVDFYFPVCFNVLPGRPAASWIPDFQHKYLPDLFSPREIALRDELCRRIVEQAKFVCCSSRTVETDFWRFYPDSEAVTRVLALRVSPEEYWYASSPLAIQEKYGLPDHFILCSNQFWLHKNHRRLFEAIALLKRKGDDVHLVCTGATNDYRSPGYFQELLQYLEEQNIKTIVHILGVIPRPDQIQLIRRSLFVVQPSLFEGLSLIVQESRALGKTILMSDIDVHLEYECGVYFNHNDVGDLARKISDLIAISRPGPDFRRETEAKIQAAGLTTAYAKEFCKLVQDAQTMF